MIRLKRVYETPDKSDGFRILVDRLWPRGLSKEKAKVDLWMKDIAPSDNLRKWFGHDPAKCVEFRKRYFRELDGKKTQIMEITGYSKKRVITLLFAAKDEKCNNAETLKKHLDMAAG